MTAALKQWLLIIVFVSIIVGAFVGLRSLQVGLGGMQTLLGQEVTMKDVANAAPIVLVMYWDVSCKYCKDAIPTLNRLAQEGLPIVAINYKDSMKQVQKYVTENGVKYAVLVGGKMPYSGTPAFEVYHNGVLEDQWVGWVSSGDPYTVLANRLAPHFQD